MWYKINNEEGINTPSMLLFPDRIRGNIQKMIDIAGNPDRLWPHVKSHKIPEVVDMQIEMGITRFKCATIAEGEMVASRNPTHILIAYPLIKSGIDRFLKLVEKFPDTRWALVTDSKEAVKEIASKNDLNLNFDVFLDVDMGMHRTGIAPDQGLDIYQMLVETPNISCGGLHLYDGHLHQPDREEREQAMLDSYKGAALFMDAIRERGWDIPLVIAGGSPTFPLYAKMDTALSPGTTILWDAGYGHDFPELEFQPAAVLIARIVSKPGSNRICVDLGHKAVASEMKHAPVALPQLKEFEIETHSEEHMVIRTEESDNWHIGDCLYATPWHICPSMDLDETALVVKEKEVVDEWNMIARKRKITI